MTPAKRPRRLKVPAIPKGRKTDVRREEFNAVIDRLNERADLLNRIVRDQEIQFQRIAQLQAALDLTNQLVAQLRLRLRNSA